MELGRVGTRLAKHLAGIPHADGHEGKTLCRVSRGGGQSLPQRVFSEEAQARACIVREDGKTWPRSLAAEPQLELQLGEGGWEIAPFQKPCSCQPRVQVNRLLQDRRGRRVGISPGPSPAQACVRFYQGFEATAVVSWFQGVPQRCSLLPCPLGKPRTQ